MGPRVPRAGVRSLGVGEARVGGKESLVPDIVGYGVQGASELVLVCWWAGPKPNLSWGEVWHAVGRLQDSGFLLSSSWWVTLVSRRVQVSYGSGGSQGFLEQDPALW